ncbi:MAG: tRNA glutamyl-Q(34) synthetase GluQRS [Clostridia bacterium]|nr:tRNA glutamyl-Q(34) synthetase GluQRS [Clostridia bacterium]
MITGRFAPTPSGRLHLGNLLCALLAYLSVRCQGGKFLLRIEDLDVPRCPRRLSLQCIEDLAWLGFTWDEEPLWQSQRSDIYQHYLDELQKQGLIYPCFCTRAQLMASQAPNLGDTQVVYNRACAHLSNDDVARLSRTRSPALRLRVPDAEVTFTDGLFGPQRENLARDCGDFILRRSDGLFGYQLAVVVDDALSGVNQVVRGRDILSATPRQLYLLEKLGFPAPEYVHIPLLMDHDGRRLAKRDKDLDLSALSRRFTPEDILGMLAYSAGIIEENRPMTLEQLIPLFSWEKVKRSDIRLPEMEASHG